MSEIIVNKTNDNPTFTRFELELMNDNNVRVCTGGMRIMQTRYGDGFITTMAMGSVATPLEYRRRGHVRTIFDSAYKLSADENAVVSLLHPFSFSYYRMFGYGKVADHIIARCPIRLIDFVPRCCDFVKFTGSDAQLADLIKVYNEFSKGRLLMLRRGEVTYFGKKDIYIHYNENGDADGYIGFTTQKTLKVNHYEDGLMTVHELAYTSPEALRAIFGLIRMYEGELDDVEFANIAMCPEVERSLRHYTHTSYRILPDIQGRVMNAEELLKAHKYPLQEGAFRVKVIDTLPTVAGCYFVEYGGGDCRVRRLEENAEVDMTVDECEFVRLVYGYDAINAEQAKYTEGIEITGNADDFFRAFPKMIGGMYEHF